MCMWVCVASARIYIYICIYIYMYIYICIYIYVYIYICIYIYMYIYICIYIHVCIYIHICIYILNYSKILLWDILYNVARQSISTIYKSKFSDIYRKLKKNCLSRALVRLHRAFIAL